MYACVINMLVSDELDVQLQTHALRSRRPAAAAGVAAAVKSVLASSNCTEGRARKKVISPPTVQAGIAAHQQVL